MKERKIVKERLNDRMRVKGWKRKPAEILDHFGPLSPILDHFGPFLRSKKKRVADGPTDGLTNGPTDGRTHPLIESWLTTKKNFDYRYWFVKVYFYEFTRLPFSFISINLFLSSQNLIASISYFICSIISSHLRPQFFLKQNLSSTYIVHQRCQSTVAE